MEEARWAARVLSEIGAARAAIAASYLRLWREAEQRLGDEPLDPSVSASADAEPASASPDQETKQRP